MLNNPVTPSNETDSRTDANRYLFVCVILVHNIHSTGSLSLTVDRTFDRGCTCAYTLVSQNVFLYASSFYAVRSCFVKQFCVYERT